MLFNFSKLRTAMKLSNIPTFTNPNHTANTGNNFDKLKQNLFYTSGALSLSIIGTSTYTSIFKEEEMIKMFGEQAVQEAKRTSHLIP